MVTVQSGWNCQREVARQSRRGHALSIRRRATTSICQAAMSIRLAGECERSCGCGDRCPVAKSDPCWPEPVCTMVRVLRVVIDIEGNPRPPRGRTGSRREVYLSSGVANHRSTSAWCSSNSRSHRPGSSGQVRLPLRGKVSHRAGAGSLRPGGTARERQLAALARI